MRVQITDTGRIEYNRVAEERTKYVTEMLATLDAEDLQQLKDAVPVFGKLSELYTTHNLA